MPTWKIIISFLLPALSLIGIPWAIHNWIEVLSFGSSFASIAGFILILTGVSFLAWSSVLFVAFGQGTMAPWDAPKKMIVLGPYHYVRNPMAIAIITTLWGETLLFNSFYILGWSLVYWILNYVFIVFIEEKELQKKFGESYSKYMKEVPRWMPLDKAVHFDP